MLDESGAFYGVTGERLPRHDLQAACIRLADRHASARLDVELHIRIRLTSPPDFQPACNASGEQCPAGRERRRPGVLNEHRAAMGDRVALPPAPDPDRRDLDTVGRNALGLKNSHPELIAYRACRE
jgi:hypothetical protein